MFLTLFLSNATFEHRIKLLVSDLISIKCNKFDKIWTKYDKNALVSDSTFFCVDILTISRQKVDIFVKIAKILLFLLFPARTTHFFLFLTIFFLLSVYFSYSKSNNLRSLMPLFIKYPASNLTNILKWVDNESGGKMAGKVWKDFNM